VILVADAPVTGALSYVQYGLEKTFGVEATTIASAFGHDVTITAERKNNLIQSRGLGNRNVQNLLAGNFEGIVTIEGTLATTHWLTAAWGTVASSGSTPYLHTYQEADTVPSITIENGVDLGTTDSVAKFLGCKLDEVTLTGAIGEPIRFRAVFLYKMEDEGTSLDSTAASDSETPFTFANCSVELPDATTLNRVQRLEWTMRNNLIRSHELGSRFVSKIITGPRDYSFNFDKTFENANLLEKVYGGGTGPAATVAETTLDINITNGLTSSNERHLNINHGGVKIDPYSNPQRPNEMVVETITGIAKTGSGKGEDNTATTAFEA